MRVKPRITNRGHPSGDAKAVLQAGCPRTVALTSWGVSRPGHSVRGGRQGRVSPPAGAAGACPRTVGQTPRGGRACPVALVSRAGARVMRLSRCRCRWRATAHTALLAHRGRRGADGTYHNARPNCILQPTTFATRQTRLYSALA